MKYRFSFQKSSLPSDKEPTHKTYSIYFSVKKKKTQNNNTTTLDFYLVSISM